MSTAGLSPQGVANFLGNITSILQEFERTPTPPQPDLGEHATPDTISDRSTFTVYNEGMPAEFQEGRRKLLQNTVRLSSSCIESGREYLLIWCMW